jgi:hypothetical protein
LTLLATDAKLVAYAPRLVKATRKEGRVTSGAAPEPCSSFWCARESAINHRKESNGENDSSESTPEEPGGS